MGKNENEEVLIDLMQVALFLLKKAWIMVLTAVLFACAGHVYSNYFITPTYTSNAMIYVMNVQSVRSTDLSGYASLAEDYTKIMKSRTVLESVVEKNSLLISPEQLGAKISISADSEQRLIRVAVSDIEPAVAKELCDMFCTEAEIRIEEFINEDQITIIDYGSLPEAPSSPNVSRNTMLCMFIGIILSAGILSAVFVIKDTVNSAADVEQRIGINVIGQIPNSSKLDERKHTNFGKRKQHQAKN